MDNVPASEVIELKELRIGNILSYDGKLVHVTSISMDIDDEYQDTIGFCELGKTSDEISDWNRSLVDKLNKVPLTDEILRHLGFEITKADVHNITHAYNGYLALNTYTEGGEYWWLRYYQGGTNIKIKYLHQLQNTYFAFTGNELEIIFDDAKGLLSNNQ